jgi:hypothetical protein
MVDGDQYFIDRNGDYFVPLLDYLHTGHWHVPQHLDPRMVLREADFYGIEPNWETNLTDETIPLLRKRMEKALDTQGERAVEKIKKGLLRQLRKGRGLALVILEDREVLATTVDALAACCPPASEDQAGDGALRLQSLCLLGQHQQGGDGRHQREEEGAQMPGRPPLPVR